MSVAYLCDGKACGDTCPSPDFCYRTEQIEHAVNFMRIEEDKYIEKGIDMDEMNTTENAVDIQKPVVDQSDEAKERAERRATRRFYKFLDTIYKIAQLSGFRIEGRIVVKDIHTGKVFK